MDENKLDLICDLNLYVAETFESFYKDLEENKQADYYILNMANTISKLGKVKIRNRDSERLMMAATLLKASYNILSELENGLN